MSLSEGKEIIHFLTKDAQHIGQLFLQLKNWKYLDPVESGNTTARNIDNSEISYVKDSLRKLGNN